LTARQVADLLGLSVASVLRRWRSGELPGFRLSTNCLRFRESEISAWLEGRRGPSGMPALSSRGG
jgi:excisionase family DNA binding protein